MLATTRAYDLNAVSHYGEIVKFSGYSDDQLREILSEMMRVYVSNLHSTSTTISSAEESASSPVPMLQSPSHAILPAHSLVLDTALPLLFLVSRHPRELFQASLSILVHLYSLPVDVSTLNSNVWVQRPSGTIANSFMH